MTEIKIDAVKPNLYTHQNSIYAALDKAEDLISFCTTVNEVIKKNIGVLRVTQSDMDVKTKGEGDGKKIYNVPLKQYLDLIEKRELQLGYDNFPVGTTNSSASILGLGYIVGATTEENPDDTALWLHLKKNLENPDKFFDNFEKSRVINLVLDRQKTKENMERNYYELDKKIGENYGRLLVIEGHLLDLKRDYERKLVAEIRLLKLKANDDAIESTKKDLVDRLKDYRGPCLSLDAPSIMRELKHTYVNASEIVAGYGNILAGNTWRARLLRLDP